MSPAPPAIFDRAARRLRRDRVARGPGSPLEQEIADDLGERLSAVTRTFQGALVVNSGAGHMASVLVGRGIAVTETDHGPVYASRPGVILTDEDGLDLGVGQFDLVVMPCGLDTVDDVPGALLAARRALAEGGLFIAVLIGGPSLPVLREALRRADPMTARAHPQIDVRAAGDLLTRTGFAQSVADATTLSLSYPNADRLFADVRAAGLSNTLRERYPVARATLDQTRRAFGGPTVETVTLLTLTGWKG